MGLLPSDVNVLAGGDQQQKCNVHVRAAEPLYPGPTSQFGQSRVEGSQYPFASLILVRLLYGELPGRPGLPPIFPFM